MTPSNISSNSSSSTQQPSPLDAPVQPIEWRLTLELGYEGDDNYNDNSYNDRTTTTTAAAAAPIQLLCFHCGTPTTTSNAKRCAKCRVASYCSRECQVRDWKQGGHKNSCPFYLRVGPNMTLLPPSGDHGGDDDAAAAAAPESNSSATTTAAAVRNEVFGRIRFYACPYGVHKASTLGRGFHFVQSDSTLAVLSLPQPKDCYGRPTPLRAVLVHFLTLGEFDQEVCRDDFEMAAVRTQLQQAVAQYEEEKEVVVLMRYRCGHVALGVAKLVPDFQVCKQLGRDYFSGANETAGALQLNIDDI
jgi:MYND finger